VRHVAQPLPASPINSAVLKTTVRQVAQAGRQRGFRSRRRETGSLKIKDQNPVPTQRAGAKALGVGRTTIQRDVGPNGPASTGKPNKNSATKDDGGPNGPNLQPAWFQKSPQE